MNNPVYDVIGVGDAGMDIYLEVPKLPGHDEKILAKSHAYHPGGMVANVLVALSRLGLRTVFHGLLGEDNFGKQVSESLQAEGVGGEGLILKPTAQTYFCSVMLDESGEKALIVVPTEAMFPDVEDLSEKLISQGRHVHTTCGGLAAAVKAAQVAKAHGLSVSVDIEASSALDAPDQFAALLSHTDIVFSNRQTLQVLFHGETIEENIRFIQSMGPKMVCVTLGGAGSLAGFGEQLFEIAGYPIKVVDTTGAGDVFAAGFIYGYLQGWQPEQILIFANACGAMNTRRHGGHSAAPTLDEVRRFLQGYGDDLVATDTLAENRAK